MTPRRRPTRCSRVQRCIAKAPLSHVFGATIANRPAGYASQLGGSATTPLAKAPAFQAGVAPTTKIVAVNGRQFTIAVLHHAVEDSVKSTTPIVLIVKDGEYYKSVSLDYHGGEKFPHLVRDKSKPDLIAPPSRATAGGSSTSARARVAASSGGALIRAASSRTTRALHRPPAAWSDGMASSARLS